MLGSHRSPSLYNDVYWKVIESFAKLEAPLFSHLDPEIVADVLSELLGDQKKFEALLGAIGIQCESGVRAERIASERIPNAVMGQVAYVQLTDFKLAKTVVFEIGPYFPAVVRYTGRFIE